MTDSGRGAGPDFIEALARGLDVLRSFRPGTPAMTLSEIAGRTGLARPTVRRILITLEALGYVGFGDAIEVESVTTPADWGRRGMEQGAPFAAAHSFFQTGPFRPSNLAPKVEGVLRAVLDRDAFLRAEIAHHGNLDYGIGQRMGLDRGSHRIGFQQRHAGSQPGGGDPLRMQHHHASCPMTAAAMSPQRPRDVGQLGMPGLRAKID